MVILIFGQIDIDMIVVQSGITDITVIIICQCPVACVYGGNGTAYSISQGFYADIFDKTVSVRLKEMV